MAKNETWGRRDREREKGVKGEGEQIEINELNRGRVCAGVSTCAPADVWTRLFSLTIL